MTIEDAMYVLRNAAFIGSNEDRDRMEEAVEDVGKHIDLLNAHIEELAGKNEEKDLTIANLRGQITGMKSTMQILCDSLSLGS